MADYRVQILAQLVGFDAIEAKLNALESNPIKVNVQMDTKGSNINKQMEQMASSYTNVGKKAGTNISSGMISGLRSSKVTPEIKKVTGQIAKQIKSDKDLSGALKNLYPDLDNKNINKMVSGVRAQANKLEKEQIQAQKSQAKIQQSINDSYWKQQFQSVGKKSPVLSEMVDFYKAQEKETAQIAKIQQLANDNYWKQQFQSVGKKSPVLSEMANYYKAQEKEAAQIMKRAEGISQSFAVKDVAVRNKELASQATNYKNIDSGSLDSFNKSLEESEKAYDNFTSNKNLDNARQLVNSFDDMSNASKTLENNMKILDTQGAKLVSNAKLSSLDKSIDSYMKKNNRMGKFYAQEMQKVRDGLHIGTTESEFNVATDKINALKKSISAQGLEGKTIFSELGRGFKQIGQFVGTYGGIQYGMQAIGKMVTNVRDVNSAMIELQKVSDASSGEIKSYYGNAAKSAQKYGASIDDVISSTADWSRLGYGLEDAKKLSDATTLIQKVGDNMTQESSSEGLISTLKGFRMEADEVGKIIDSVNEVANTQPIDTSGIFSGLERSASSLSAAGNTLDESIAMITAANSVVQDPASVGTAFKTMSMRVRGASTELQEAGLDAEGMAESTAKLRTEMIALSGVDIMQDENTFKSTYKIMDELADKWQGLTDIQQASVTELVAGKRQGNIMSALMSNWSIAEKALNSSINSEGSAEKELGNYQKGIQYSLDKFKAQFQDLSNTALDSDLLKTGVDMGTSLLSGVTKALDTTGGIPSLLFGGVGVGQFVKNLD